MKNRILTTTTNSIENAEIEKYIDLVSTNVVIGTNFFSDFGASFTDLFGGFSDSYQNKLQKIYSVAIDNLKSKAFRIGANAIVGLKIDFDEISGKNKSMFMISALGTAVVIKEKKDTTVSIQVNNVLNVSDDMLTQEVTKRVIISDIKNNILPSQDDWGYLLNNPIDEISENLLDFYLLKYDILNFDQTENDKLLLANIASFFKVISVEVAIKVLYSKINEKHQPILDIINKNKLFEPINIIELINAGNLDLAITLLNTDKEYYSKNDLENMKEIVNLLKSLPNKGKIDFVKGIIGKAKEKYICPNGHSNDSESKFCENYNCSLNIKGLTRKQLKSIDNFKLKVESLASIFNNN